MLRVPPATKAIALLLVGMHLLIEALVLLNWPGAIRVILELLIFTPARYQAGLWDAGAFISPLGHALLHGGWLHLVLNSVMLLACGTPVERALGPARMLLVFCLGVGAGALAETLATPAGELRYLMGASAGVFALLAATLGLDALHPRHGARPAWPRLALASTVILAASILLAVMPVGIGGANIAWIAHVGGYAVGLALFYPLARSAGYDPGIRRRFRG